MIYDCHLNAPSCSVYRCQPTHNFGMLPLSSLQGRTGLIARKTRLYWLPHQRVTHFRCLNIAQGISRVEAIFLCTHRNLLCPKYRQRPASAGGSDFATSRCFLPSLNAAAWVRPLRSLAPRNLRFPSSISGLETTIGARLFDRNAQGVEPTLYGEALSKRAIAAFDELKQGLRDLEFLANPTVGEIRIGCPDSVAATILPTMIAGFCREFPEISLRFDQVPSPTLEVPGLHARKLDMVISWLSVPKDQYDDNLNVEILYEDEVVVAAGRNSHWARRRKISLSDIADGPWTGAPPETIVRIVLDNAFRAADLPLPKWEVTTFSIPLRQHLLTLGGFLTAMPKSLLHGSSGPESAAHCSPTSRLSNSYCDGEESDLEPSCGAFS